MRKEIAITLLMALLRSAFGKGGLCEVETGQSNIIMDIEESRGTEISQETSPVELPIRGDPFTDVHLELSFPKGHPLFILNGRKLQLLQPLDRDKDNLSHIVFQVTCTDRVTNKKRTIPVIVRVSDVNDNAPEFINTPYEVSISELSPVGTTVFTGLKATDPDAGANGLVEYRVVAGRPAVARSTERLAVADGSQYFAINLPHQGQVTVVKPLDYERTQRYLLTIVASEPFSQSIENENNDTAEVMTSSPGKSFSNLTFAERSAILDGLLDLQKYGPFDIHSKNDHTSENDNSQSILELLNQSAQEEKTSLATSHSNRKSTVPDITQLFTPDQESKLHQTKPVGNTSKEPFSQSAESKNDDTAEVTTSRPLKSFSEMTLTEQNDFLDSLRDWQKYNSLDVHTKHNETSENAMFQSILELLNQLASEEQMSQSSSSRSKQNSTVQDVSNMIAPPKKSKLYEPKPLEETSKKSHPIDDLNLLQSLIEKSGKHGYNPSTNNAKLLDSNMEVDSGASNFSMLPTITFKNNVPNTNDGWDPTVSLNEKKPDLLKEMEVIIGAKFDHTKHNKRENASLAASRFESSYPQETSMVSKEPQNLSSLNQSYGYTQDGEDIGSRFQESNSKDVINETKTVDGPEKNRVPNKPDELKKPVIYIGATIQNPLKEKKINNTKNALISGSSILPKGKQLTFKEPDLNGYDVHRLLNETEKNESYLKTPEHFEMEAADILKDRARNQTSRLSSTTTLTVNVKDDDDQNPSFIYQGCVVLDGSCVNPEYYTTVSSGVLAGVLTIHPEKIQAVDMDSLNTPIVYSFLSGNPDNFRDFFEINPNTGVVRQVRAVDSTISKKFTIIVKAEEASEGRRFATAKLVITVKPVDASPPLLAASAKEGFVQENSPIGTRILDANAKPITLSVTDADLGPDDPKPTYVFELTTNYFDVDSEGYLTVGEENLDRDPPSPGLFRFQVVAREKTGSAASAPITLSVVLTDVNDNAPRLPMIPPVEVQAGEGHREIVNVTATDNDLGENAIISYSIYHVSNNGRNKFQIDPLSGVIESVGKLNAGEQYSITVQATDSGGKHSQTIVEIKVVPGPNTRSPVFKENTYEVTVSEGAPINSTVTTIYALDPEKEPVTYSIIAGNDLRQFGINDKSGVISVRRKLDREDLTRYQLLIKAEDEGGLSSTATVNIHVSDINDKNPEFVGEPYDWKVREGLVGAHVGVVEATDADEGINANITYSVPDEVPFTINPQTGTVMTSTSLDYEKQKEYKFVVTAKDGAMEPRLATATVTVSVVDVEDEMPIFHKPFYEATVPENTPDYFVTQVTADDPDTVKKINYVMKQGPTELFSVDPHDGTIKTLKGLDYESEPEYDLVIGTLENNTTHKGSTTTVRIRVTDVNDIPPVFLTTSGPVTLDDNVSIGTVVTTLVATDSDGTAPGNKIRYEIVGRGKATKYFQIDPDLGKVTVRDDLRKEPDIDYQVDVKAYDLGDPQLSSVTSVPVFVRHVAVASPPIHLGFPDDSYTLQVPEDTKPGSLLKSFAVIASTSVQHIPLRCSIVNGNNESLFFVNITGEKTCDLHLANKSLDYEKKNEYVLRLRLDSLADYVNHNKSVTTVKIQVTDVNDNTPKFVYPSNSKLFKKDKYFGAVAKDKKEVRTILQVKAEDKDSSGLTQLEYMLEPTEMNEFFGIDSASGNIRLRRSVDGLKPEELPVRLTVLVTDGKENGHTATAQVVINLIDEKDWLVLPIGKVAPEAVSDKEAQITELLSQATGTLVGVQRIGPLESTPDNVTLASDPTSTDLWLYFIDPETEMILPINDTNLAKTVKDEDVLANITAEVTTALGGGILYPLHSPIKVRAIKTAVVALDWEVFPYAVILIAGLILVLGTAGIVYICISWQRYKAYKERMQRMYVMPRYDPVFVEPNLKEYETQVLQMSVPMDDNDSYHDLQLDFSRKNHAFSLDNVSYITKDHGDNVGLLGGQSPTSSEAATTTRASSLGRHNNNNIHREGAINLSYDRSDDEMGHNSSPTNENVTFREKKDYSHLGFNYLMDRSPIETTTEL